jgi:nucleoside-diphosphate-sugar epimerase
MKENILITGHKGLIGGEIYNHLKKRYNVYGYDNLKDKKSIFNLDNKIHYHYIIHCAANCVIREIIKEPHKSLENIILNYNIMELARKYHSKIFLFSSGRVNHKNMNPYVVSKLYLENLAKSYKECYDLDSIIIRPETVWGYKRDNPVRVIPNWINCAKKNKDIIIFGSKDKELPPIRVDDFTIAFLKIFKNFDKNKNKTFAICGYPQKAETIAKQIIKKYKSKSKIIFKSPELSQPQKYKANKNTIYLKNVF